MTKSGWQPIDTAPKDGTVVDIWLVDEKGEGWREPNAYWVIQRALDSYRSDSGTRDGWFAPNNDYDGDAGWADEPEWSSRDGIRFVRATHWMPVPGAPT